MRAAKLLGFVTILGLTACAQSVPAPVILPTFLPPAEAAVPEPNEAYPTAAASEVNSSQTAGGFSVDLQRAWRDGKQVYAELCFPQPDASDWTIWAASFGYGGNTISEFSSSLLSKQEGAAGEPSQRCDQLAFYVPPDADISSASLTVESVGTYPTGDEYCSFYMPKIQQSLDERGIGITLDCPEVDGAMSMQIASKPENMSQEEAEQLVFSDEFYTVKGPWTFPVTFSQ